MTKLLERLESRIGRQCPECGLKEWDSHFEIHEVKHWTEPTQGWYDGDYQIVQIVEYTHLTCGHTWTVQQETARPTYYAGF